ncbi:hypothetical protein TRFO_28757 [Tritrichomonas foetus]|uniref:Uncharacterized protein n=1 Tax=Tritrichomonas foetus TaxID=1144522 RepID=A0A1J4JXN0_9EUKA|nr:hypothetical protein TRFO_28757 [Tritrichomonas foetus]|eukprot:OHT03911.1 hypothetical protein TRFO_28757 [Tritrichomonas foetus]
MIFQKTEPISIKIGQKVVSLDVTQQLRENLAINEFLNSSNDQNNNQFSINLPTNEFETELTINFLKGNKIVFNRLNIDFLEKLGKELKNEKLNAIIPPYKVYLNSIKSRFNESHEFFELLCSEKIAFEVNKTNLADFSLAAQTLISTSPRQFVRVLVNSFFIRNSESDFLLDFVHSLKSSDLECFLQCQMKRQIKIFTEDEMKTKSFSSLDFEIPSFLDYISKSLNTNSEIQTDQENSSFNDSLKPKDLQNSDAIGIYIRNDDVESLEKVISGISSPQQQIKLTSNDRAVFPKKIEQTVLVSNPTSDPTLVEYAAFYGASKCFNFLLSKGGEVTEYLPKHALCGGNLDIINQINGKDQILIKNLDLAIKFHRTSAFIHLFEKFIKENKISNNDLVNYGIKSIRFCSFKILKYLIEFGVDLNQNMINEALKTDLQSLFIFLLGFDGIDMNKQDKNDFTPLHCAIRAGNLEATKMILKEKGNEIDINLGDHCGRAPLQFAAIVGNLEIFKFLLQQPNTDVLKIDDEEMTSLHYAARQGNINLVQEIIKIDPKTVNCRNSALMTPLHYACIKGWADITKLLLEIDGIDVNPHDIGSWTPLHYAVENGYSHIVEALLNHPNINPNVIESVNFLIFLLFFKNIYDSTPLINACENQKVDIIKMLLSHKNIDVNVSDNAFFILNSWLFYLDNSSNPTRNCSN